MKVAIKDLKPNPFRDMDHYPINEEKIQSLTNSINETGFWDNILARKKNGKIQIAYGHHRLVILQRNFKPDHIIDIPVRDLDDPTMIRIMANENDESWGTNPKIIDETVRVTRDFLFSRHGGKFIKTKNPKAKIDYHHSKEAFQISEFLGGNWYEARVYLSLERLGLIEKGILDKETIEQLPTEHSVRSFVRAIKKVKDVTPEQQKRAVEKIVETQDFSKEGIEYEILEEKYKFSEKEKKERKFEDFLNDVTKRINSLKGDLKTILGYRESVNLDLEFYQKHLRKFAESLGFLDYYIQKFKKGGGELD